MEPVSTTAVGRARVALCADFFVFGVGIGIWAVNIPLVAARLDLNTAMVGTVLLTVAMSAIVAMPLGGFAVGKWGSRLPAIVGGLVYSLAIAALVLAPSLAVLFLAAAVLGLSMGFFEVAMNAQGTEIEAVTGSQAFPYSTAFSVLAAWPAQVRVPSSFATNSAVGPAKR
jgi:MFS family permease